MVTSLGREVYSLPHSVSEGFGPWKVRSEACVRDVTTVHVTHLSQRGCAVSALAGTHMRYLILTSSDHFIHHYDS